jgi:hypothetical protein
MTKQTHILNTAHRVWTVEVRDTPEEFQMLVSWNGKWFLKEEAQFNEWVGSFDIPFASKKVRTTFEDNGSSIIHYPDGMILHERPGMATEITLAEP